MPNAAFRVVRRGKGTFVGTRSENGKVISRFHNRGSAVDLGSDFSSKGEAVARAQEALKNDPGGIFYVSDGDTIVETVWDRAWHTAQTKKSDSRFAVGSICAIAALAAYFSPFHSPLGVGAFALTFAAIQALLLWMFGAGNLEGTVLVLILLAVAVVGASAARKAHQRRHPELRDPSRAKPVLFPGVPTRFISFSVHKW